MRQQKEVDVETTAGTCKVLLTAMDGHTGSMLGMKLLQVLGGSITAVVAALETNDVTKVAEAGGTLFQKLTPELFVELRKQLFTGAQIQIGDEFHDLNMDIIKEYFAANLGSMFLLIGEGLRLNFSNFFVGLGLKPETVARISSKAKTAAEKAMK